MVGNENADILFHQTGHDRLNIVHSNRIDAGKRFVQHDKLRTDGQAASNFRTTTFTSGQTIAQVFTHFIQVKFSNEAFHFLALLFGRHIGHLQHRKDIIFDRHFAENGSFLRQITDAGLRTLVHRIAGNIGITQENTAFVGHHQAGGHVESGGFSGTIRS